MVLSKKTFSIAVLVICLLGFVHTKIGAATGFSAILDGEHFTLQAEGVPLRQILMELVAQGINVKVDPQINPAVTANYFKKPTEQVFDAILKSASYSLVWEARKNKDNLAVITLEEIQIFQSGKKEMMLPLMPVKKIAVVENKDGTL